MLFNSHIFIFVFLPCVIAGYFLLNHWRKENAAKVFLAVMSLVFYGYYHWSYLYIIIGSILVNYTLGRLIIKDGSHLRRIYFYLALLLNLGTLFIFKYLDFAISNVNALCGTKFALHNIALPLGISFFTFQQLSFIIDSYKTPYSMANYRFRDYALFVAYFPQLIAGPIVTHDEMVPQFADCNKKAFSMESFSCGLYGFILGLAKKVLLADSFGRAVDAAYGDVESLTTATAFFIMFAYTLQIYFDFSGYCDMATGIGKMMNIDIASNFNSPYKALNIAEFWKRWHITLTRFFTRYLYIPLGGSRAGRMRTCLNILIVFLVSGLWHGANWTFIVWGGANGFFLIINKLNANYPRFLCNNVGKFLRWCFTFLLINLLWVCFRSKSIDEAALFYAKLFKNCGMSLDTAIICKACPSILQPLHYYLSISTPVLVFVFMLAVLLLSVLGKNTQELMRSFRPTLITGVTMGILLACCILSLTGISSFLYWNF